MRLRRRRQGSRFGWRPGGTAEAAGSRPWGQVRTPVQRPAPSGPRHRGPVEACIPHGEGASSASRGSLFAVGLGGRVSVPAPQPRERPRSCPQLQLGGVGPRRGKRWRVTEAKNSALVPTPVLSRRLAGVVLFASPAPELRTVAETGRQETDGCCPGMGRAGFLSTGGGGVGGAPPHRSCGPGLCPSGVSGVGAAVADGEGLGAGLRRGASGAGLPGGAGLGSLLPPVLCSVARLFSPSPYCVKRPLAEPAAVAAPGAFRGSRGPSPMASGGADRPDPAAPGQFPVCETAGGWGWPV